MQRKEKSLILSELRRMIFSARKALSFKVRLQPTTEWFSNNFGVEEHICLKQ